MTLFAVGAYFVGLAAHFGFVALHFGEIPQGAVMCVGLMVYLLVALPFWVLSLALARKILLSPDSDPSRQRLTFISLPCIVAIVPAAAMLTMIGGGLRSVVSSEMASFLVLYAVAGVTFGAGWHICFGNSVAPSRRE